MNYEYIREERRQESDYYYSLCSYPYPGAVKANTQSHVNGIFAYE